MKQEKMILVGVILVIVFAILVMGLRDANKKVERLVEVEKQVQQETEEKKDEKVEKKDEELKVDEYEETADTFMKDSYMEGCYTGNNLAFCECTYDKIVNKYGIDAFLEMSLEYEKTGDITDEMERVVIECLDTIK